MEKFSRAIFIIHRWVGVGIGLMIALWCVSGFIMMYVPFPEVTKQDQLLASPRLDFTDCCVLPPEEEFSPIELSSARISNWPFRPILFLNGQGDGQYAIDMHDGEYIWEVDIDLARRVARQYGNQIGSGTNVQFESMIESDQWTVTGYFDGLRPFYRFRPIDGKGTRLYVSSVTGEVVQHTERWERFWNWGGAVIHWLYPSIIRQHQALWYWTVVVLSIIGLFLTLTGLYVGLSYLQYRKGGTKSPFTGVGLWHHWLGLAFGILTLTWLFSGLISMNPWGLFESRSGVFERAAVRGGQMIFSEDLRDSLRQLGEAELSGDTVWIELIQIDGDPVAILYNKSGDAIRYDPTTWQPVMLENEYFARMAQRIKPETQIRSAEWMEAEDDYYYSLKSQIRLPVYRVIYEDGERAYFDNVSGELIAMLDNDRKWYRWLFKGLHSLDFTGLVRQRPLWDVLVLLLLGGVTAGALTGVWLGWVRITGGRN